ncbi:glycoside hydrolase family 3 protein [Thioclava sp. BHET1]|nr:glycoside hydrolase family 3 protein [Thioclava sp. BHET1]
MTSATILGCAGLRLSRAEAAFFREADPWGFILFARNVETPDQLRALTQELRETVGRDAVVTLDQEGGRVQRLRAPHWREFLPALDQCERAGAAHAARAMALRFALISAELRDLGLDSNCAPVADVATAETHPFLRNRCYGDNAAVVTRIARAASDAMLAGGVLPVIKHMPGHGRVFTAFDPDAPATQSPEMIRIIREEIGFGGLLISDDLNMQALGGTLSERAEKSVRAGCDIALHCAGVMAEMEAVVAVAGAMTPAARARGDAALAMRRTPEAVDTEALAAELEALLTGPDNG